MLKISPIMLKISSIMLKIGSTMFKISPIMLAFGLSSELSIMLHTIWHAQPKPTYVPLTVLTSLTAFWPTNIFFFYFFYYFF